MGNVHANHVTYTVGPQLSEHLIIQNGFLHDTIGHFFGGLQILQISWILGASTKFVSPKIAEILS